MTLVSITNFIFSLLTILSQLIIGLIILGIITSKKNFLNFFSQKAIIFSFVIALGATLGSLFYSEIIGFEPCKLCWFQRIFIYPQVILFAIALLKKNENQKLVIYNGLSLSIIGALISLYHYILQIGVTSSLPCGATQYSISCSERFVMEFGYITLPMMALTAFIFIITLLYLKIKNQN
jgi:disulfide bond formation protein DsbB